MDVQASRGHVCLVAFVLGCGRTNLDLSDVLARGGQGVGASGGSGTSGGMTSAGRSAGGASGSAGLGHGGAPAAGAGGSNPGGAGGTAGTGTPSCYGAVTGDVFDPQRVYLAGTLSSGSCNQDAIVTVECPNSAAVGFDCNFDGNAFYDNSAQIRPNDGRLLYTQFGADVREFRCDLCPYLDDNGNRYPRNVLDNDPILVTSTPPSSFTADFFVSPQSDFFYRRHDGAWVDEGGRVVYSEVGWTLVYFGFGALALANPDPPSKKLKEARVVNLEEGSSVPVIGMPDAEAFAIRAAPPDLFLVALPEEGSMFGEGTWQLWEIDATGAATRRGDYPPYPPGIGPAPGAKLLPDGVLYQIARESSTINDVIVRRQVGGPSEVVYTEGDHPHVEIHISGLVTGP